MVLAALIRSIIIHNYEGAAVCLLTLVLFILPSFLEGSLQVEGGYLDIGILDTMKDLLVNLIGAVVFCIFGFVYLHSGSKRKVASSVVEGLRIQPAGKPTEEEKEA